MSTIQPNKKPKSTETPLDPEPNCFLGSYKKVSIEMKKVPKSKSSPFWRYATTIIFLYQSLLVCSRSFSHASGAPARPGQTTGSRPRTMTARKMQTLQFLSGGVAGTVASCITNPLEVIKTQIQSSNQELMFAKKSPLAVASTILEKDGVPGFFRGLPPTLVGIIPARSAYFYIYQRTKKFLSPKLAEGSPGNALVAGLMAGIAGNTLTNPIWMVRTRMQLITDHTAGQKEYAGYWDAITTIFKEEGIGGFYKGITASYWGCAEGALQFIVYEQMKMRLLAASNERRSKEGFPYSDELPKATYFWAAAASKAVAAVATYPHEVARTRLREQARAGVFKYTGMWQTLRLMAAEEGPKSLYAGMGIHLLKVVPNSATMFLCYEIVRSWLDQYEVSSI